MAIRRIELLFPYPVDEESPAPVPPAQSQNITEPITEPI